MFFFFLQVSESPDALEGGHFFQLLFCVCFLLVLPSPGPPYWSSLLPVQFCPFPRKQLFCALASTPLGDAVHAAAPGSVLFVT